jgi:serine protease DegS
VGINTAIFTSSGGSQGIGFAIPVNLAREVMTAIVERGRVSRGWLGVEVRELTPPLAESLGLGIARGVLVAGVLREGPADRAGVAPGDVITALDGIPVSGQQELLQRVARVRPGSPVQVEVAREDGPVRLQVQVDERPPPDASRR